MNTLTLTEIVPYLPYSLIAKKENSDMPFLVCVPSSKTAPNEEDFEILQLHKWAEINFGLYKPVLIPISHLTKPMDDGRVPLIECAKIAFPDMEWSLSDIANVAVSLAGSFGYDEEQKGFYLINSDFDVLPPNNQLALFQELAKMKIDFQGLIERGLAIDATTLPNNPYSK